MTKPAHRATAHRFVPKLKMRADNREPSTRLDGKAFRAELLDAAMATASYYLDHCCSDGVPMWDTGAPNLHRLPADYLDRSADPFNRWEPVDSSAAAIAAQGLIRLGNYLATSRSNSSAHRFRQAGLSIANTLLDAPYLSTHRNHQGLLLHSLYHRPRGWDYVAPGQKVPNGESSMWGDYHLRELALLLLREARCEPYLTFFGCLEPRTRRPIADKTKP
jgi:hypothetical protein